MKNLNPLFIKIGIGVVFVTSLLFNFKQHNDNKIANNNVIALSDTLKTTRNKVGEEVKSRQILLMNIDQLKSTNNELSLEVNKLSAKDKKNLIDIAKADLTISILRDSLQLNDGLEIVINDSTAIYPYTFDKTDSTRSIQGTISVAANKKPIYVKAVIDNYTVNADITIRKEDTKTGIQLFASSSNKNVKINDIKGSVIDLSAYNKYQKAKPFGIGLHVGYGISGAGLSPYIGIGVSYNLIRF